MREEEAFNTVLTEVLPEHDQRDQRGRGLEEVLAAQVLGHRLHSRLHRVTEQNKGAQQRQLRVK